MVRPGRAPVPAWDPQTWVHSLLCLHHCVTWGKPCPSLGRVYTEGKGWALLALMWAPGLPSLWANVADVQVRCLPGERLGLQLGPVWASWRQPYASPLTAVGTGVGPWRHTHITQLRTLTAMLGLCKCTHMHVCAHGHAQTPRYTHEHTHSLSPWQRHSSQPPPAVSILYPQGPGLDNTPSSWAPPSPSLSPTLSSRQHHPSSCGLSHPEAHRVRHQHVGGVHNRCPPSQSPLPPHSCPRTSPTSPPEAPTQTRHLPPTHRPFLPTA